MTDSEKKTRTPKPIFIEEWEEWIEQTDKPAAWVMTRKCATISEAEKWLKKEGKAGGVYRIITVEREITLVVESKRVASFA